MVIRGVSVPLGFTTPGQPNISSTIWRTLYDHGKKIFYFDSATSPTIFWTPLPDMDFNEGAPVKKLTLSDGETFNGNAALMFLKAEPFKFLPATAK